MKKIVVILYGPPGSGKGTQANLLAQKLNLIHFDTGKYLEAVVNDPARQREKTVKHEKKLFDKGILMTPSFALREVANASKKIAKAGWGLVFSGSPRTVYEGEHILPLLQKLYGRGNIFIFKLALQPSGSIRRNSSRLMCSVCDYGLLSEYYPVRNPKFCPVCGGKFYKRSLDNPKVIKVRLEEYKKRTEPILGVAKRMGYIIREIDGSTPPHKVLKLILHKMVLPHFLKSHSGREKISSLNTALLASSGSIIKESISSRVRLS